MTDIAEILKNAPKGLKLYSLIHGKVTLKSVNTTQEGYPIVISTNQRNCTEQFSKDGKLYNTYNDAECILFPSKEHKSWDNWQEVLSQRGDVITVTGKETLLFNSIDYAFTNKLQSRVITKGIYRYATPEEREQFMAELNANGYKWNADTKQMEKIEQQYTPKFKVNEHIIGDDFEIYKVINIRNLTYTLYSYTTHSNFEQTIKRIDENYKTVTEQELIDAGIKEKPFTIDDFKPTQFVLVRDWNWNDEKWNLDIFSYVNEYGGFVCVGEIYDMCIPYNDETKHLLGTTDDCPNKYKTW